MTMRTIAGLALVGLCLSGCVTGGDPAVITDADRAAMHRAADSFEPPPECTEANIRPIVEANLPKALSYPPGSAHRDLYLETMNAQFNHMRALSYYPLSKEKCDIILKGEILRFRLKLEGMKFPKEMKPPQELHTKQNDS